MMETRPLQDILARSASLYPEREAVEDPGRAALDYAGLDALSDRLRDRLVHLGVRRGDRVGIYMRKSIDSVASIFGILKAGAAYVPVDPDAPPERCAYILNDCAVAVIITEARLNEPLREALDRAGRVPAFLLLDHEASAEPLRSALDAADKQAAAPQTGTARSDVDDLAYILYTSGSTGRPKGVMLSHRAARCFTGWCAREFAPVPEDVYSSHAPLHFDLSIHDVFVPLEHGAKLVLIGEALGKDPAKLAPLIAEKRISVWYSTPSILSLLAHHGKLDRFDYSALRLVLFAGEVFPVPQLRAIREEWTAPRYFNLYGPTETNVCTSFEIPAEIPEDRTDPFPIGKICPPLRGRVVDGNGSDVSRGDEGELVVHGPGVMSGYWNLPDQNARAFLVDELGERWYRTGDLVVENGEGDYVFHGRRDRMVKRRGYRVELGEIEAGLARHPAVREVAVVALPDSDAGVRIRAFLGTSEGASISIISLKQFSTAQLPRYMVPDVFSFVESLPRTSTDKIDYQSLLARE
jgi:amino acid adenylation domain-containing protein